MLALIAGTVTAWTLTAVLIGPPPLLPVAVGTVYGVIHLAFAVAMLAAACGLTTNAASAVLLTFGVLALIPILGIVPSVKPWLPSELVAAIVFLLEEPQVRTSRLRPGHGGSAGCRRRSGAAAAARGCSRRPARAPASECSDALEDGPDASRRSQAAVLHQLGRLLPAPRGAGSPGAVPARRRPGAADTGGAARRAGSAPGALRPA